MPPIPRALEVVIITDEQNTPAELVQLIRRRGHAARLAYDNRAALRLVADRAADVVLLDLDMPHFDGCALAKQLRVDSPGKECFIIALTDKANKRCRRMSREAGIDIVLIKPVPPLLFETLLLLECGRVNRLDAEHKPGLVTKETVQRKQAARWDVKPPEPRS